MAFLKIMPEVCRTSAWPHLLNEFHEFYRTFDRFALKFNTSLAQKLCEDGP